jgi:hypothetical protein
VDLGRGAIDVDDERGAVAEILAEVARHDQRVSRADS